MSAISFSGDNDQVTINDRAAIHRDDPRGVKENDKAWVLKDVEVCKYVVFPHPNYSGRAILGISRKA
jgi:hypothetical protein